nr:N-6 DNA methylase [Paludibacteraceae bacterium]
MAFFQNTVTDKYLNTIDKLTIQNKYEQFKEHFHNPQIQQNIRNSKEEQYQEGFLRDLFVHILGYTLNPQHNFNLTTEYKNVKDSKKADGAIIIADKVKAVIELKGTDTTDLGKIETQAFGYKNNQPNCVYIITSNFEKLRFYIDNAIEHLEFNLFTLTEKQFELLYICLAYENIEKGIAKKIKVESISQEDTITKKLYKDYSLFKRELHQNLVQLNPEYDELDLFKKSQKLLDRFLFLFFAEDRQLLPPNSVRLILNDWRDLQDRDVEIPLYDRFKKYFGYLNTGFKGKRYDVFAYNGGLFKPDAILDTVKIDDELLFNHTFKISDYDFASEVDVNILGHIFENSLNELDEIKAQLAGQEIDKSKTKRKKDGVFYTPKYITKYIVENTVGKLCTEKKQALHINEEDYTSDNRIQKKTKQAHLDKLTTYRAWLLQLTICDPACGSGAFLNQALDFLIAEHRYVDELQAKLFGDSLVLSDVEKSILENNLFGVDLNEESVEIAKLSLWLRTAQPNRRLNNLNNNIKCGNSLIDDPAIAGDKAFSWQQAFPQVFKEKQKKAWHITTATHNSRYSQRMFDNHVVVGETVWLDKDDEIIITQTVRDIAIEDNLNIIEYNICGDHMHLL